jgi:hypothetical protein
MGSVEQRFASRSTCEHITAEVALVVAVDVVAAALAWRARGSPRLISGRPGGV